MQRWSFLPARHVGGALPHAVVTGEDDPSDDPRATWMRVQREIAKTKLEPFLTRLLTAPTRIHSEVRASALISLAKIADSSSAAEVIFLHAEDPRQAALTREAAALAIGLLRREDKDRQFAATKLDSWRTRLFGLVDDSAAPTRTRAFAAFSLGLLADQPYATAFTKQGREVIRGIWQRLSEAHAVADVPVALITALGLQPPSGVASGVREGLQQAVLGRVVQGRRFGRLERPHALTALMRLGGGREQQFLLRLLPQRSTPREVREAAWIVLADHADGFDADGRKLAFTMLEASEKRARTPLARGLLSVARARLLAADLRYGERDFAQQRDVVAALRRGANAGNAIERAWGALALGLACRDVEPKSRAVTEFVANARTTITRALDEGRGDDEVRSAFAAAAGIADAGQAKRILGIILADRNRQPGLRGHAAISLALLGAGGADARKSLLSALWDRRTPDLSSQAALALSILGEKSAAPRLVREFRTAKTERRLAQLAHSLGQFGDLGAVDALIDAAKDVQRPNIGRALAITALGLLLDPAPKPSLSLLSDGACYTALTNSLHEALTIL